MAYSDTILADSPAAYWRLGEAAGTTADNAEGTSALDGTYTGTYTLGATSTLGTSSDTALSLSSAGYVTVADNAALDFGNGPFSYECWCRIGVDHGGMLISKGISTGALVVNASGIVLFYSLADSLSVNSGTVTVDDGADHHIVGTKDSSNNWKLYIDGTDVTVVSVAGATTASNSTALVIGADASDLSTKLTGVIDEVAVYASVLSSGQVLAHYQAGTLTGTEARAGVAAGTAIAHNPPYSGSGNLPNPYPTTVGNDAPIAWWRLGEASGSIAENNVGGADGSYVNTPTLGATSLLSSETNTAVTFARASLECVSVTTGIPAGSSAGATIEAWVKWTSLAAETIQTIVRWGPQSGTVGFHWFYYDNRSGENGLRWQFATGVANITAEASWTPSVGTTYHLVAVHDYSLQLVRWYVNDSLVATTDLSSAGGAIYVPANAETYIAGYSASLHMADATFDEVAIYDYALTATRVSSHYSAGTGGTPGTGVAVEAGYATGSGTAHGIGNQSLQTLINSASAGSTIDVTGRTFTAGATVNKALTIIGGTITLATNTTALTITASNVTINGMAISLPQYTTYVAGTYGILVSGTHSAHLTGLTIKNCTISSIPDTGIWYYHTTGATIHHNTITNVLYTGIMAFCARSGSITWNRVLNVGVYGTDIEALGYNAYGIAVTGHYQDAAQQSADIEVTDNYVYNVPWWHALDTHSGARIAFRRNVALRTRKALWASNPAGNPVDFVAEENFLLDPAPITYGSPIPTSLVGVDGATFTKNVYIGWGTTWTPPATEPWYNYLNSCTGLVDGGGNVCISGKGAATAIRAYLTEASELVGPIEATGSAHNATVKLSTGTSGAPVAGVGTGTGAAYATRWSTKGSAGQATGTGSAHNATARGTAQQTGVAAGTGVAQSPSAKVDVRPGVATGTGAVYAAQSVSGIGALWVASATGTANGVTAKVKATVPAATGTGSAYQATGSQGTRALAVTATGTAAAANAIAATVIGGWLLQAASATGSAAVASVSGKMPVPLVTATGAAQGTDSTVGATSRLASGTGSAANVTATVSSSGSGFLQTATATGEAQAPTGKVSATTVVATGTGTANQPAASPGKLPVAGVAAGTGAAGNVIAGTVVGGWTLEAASATAAVPGATGGTGASGPAATATGAAANAAPAFGAVTRLASSTGTANDATAGTINGTFAAAGVATATGEAFATAPSVAVGPPVMTGTAEAYGIDAGSAGRAGVGAATGAAADAGAKVTVYAGVATAVGAALPVTFTLRASGGIATSSGAALVGSTALGGMGATATASGTAHGVTWAGMSNVTATAGVATGTATAWRTKRGHRGGTPPRGKGHHWTPRSDAATVS